jgi:amino acid adenylation domain-containing protein
MIKRSLNKILALSLDKFESRRVFSTATGEQTLGHLFKAANTVATAVATKRKPGPIAFFTSDEPWSYAVMLAAIVVGRPYVPIGRHYPDERVRYILDDCQPACVFGDWPRATGDYPFVCTRDLKPFHEPLLPEAVSDAKPAYILYTSGSTGRPKGVVVPRSALTAFLLAAEECYGVNEKDVVLQMFEQTFDLSGFGFWMSVLNGAKCVVVPRDSPSVPFAVAEALMEKKITVALTAPSVIGYLRPYLHEILAPSVRLHLFCGEALYQKDVADWAPCVPNAQIENVYGPTEATVFCTRHVWNRRVDESLVGIVPIGRPLPGVHTLIDSHPRGELLLAGEQLADGYLNLPEKTNAAFVIRNGTRYYKTGDEVFANANGLNFVGRMDFQLKVDGYRIEPGEIESVIHELTACRAVVLLKDGILTAFIESNDGSEADIKLKLALKFPAYMVPKSIVFTAPFPQSDSDKIDRKKLAEIRKTEALNNQR